MILVLLGDGVVANALLKRSKGENSGWIVITMGWGVAVAIAVYAVGRKVHALRLSDGRDAIVATAPRAVEALAIERPGLVYAYNTVKGIKDVGNLAFVPLAKATSALS